MDNPKHVVLTGFVNSGKSLWGRQLEAKFGVPYVNLGHEFRQSQGSARKADADFIIDQSKWIETQQLRLENAVPSVINVPGNSVLFDKTMEALKPSCYIIFLSADYDVLNERLPFKEKGPNAILFGASTYEKMFEQRQPLYAKHANATIIETDNPKEDFNRICEIVIREHLLGK
jgi:shikimate kinase